MQRQHTLSRWPMRVPEAAGLDQAGNVLFVDHVCRKWVHVPW
jgi:hypothetical protein